MAARFSVGFFVAAPVSSGAAYAEMIAGATKSISVRAVRVTAASDAGGTIALQRSFAVGTGTTVHTGVPHRTGSVEVTGKVFAAWSSNPTGIGGKLRADVLPLGTGSTRDLWREEDGPLTIEPSKSLLLMNHGSGIAGGSLYVNVTWEEGPASDS